ncbi:type 4a pilus biogenesis protein PilO [Vibrio sp. TH_r3]|uniref:type 4a pilus biogenesis protein PilO n=1 Tax=Vibrio sp. TH_r3 TaxID=3082084 RepID=UPI00295590DB|nr:type 4a pilus biogenesis protein PilO [Vibrio sp. TH_r3]MDV7104237.1 type 4a pilus biogenesis protein PilO [Vibrio sp. TH_r3]
MKFWQEIKITLSQLQIDDLAYKPIYIQLALILVLAAIFQLLLSVIFISPKMSEKNHLYTLQSEAQIDYQIKRDQFHKEQSTSRVALEQLNVDKKLQVSEFLQALPNNEHLTTILTSINQKARENKLEVIDLSWGQKMESNFLYQLAINIQLRGKYHDVAYFSQDIATLSNLVVIDQLSLKNSLTADQLLDIRITALIYQVANLDNNHE